MTQKQRTSRTPKGEDKLDGLGTLGILESMKEQTTIPIRTRKTSRGGLRKKRVAYSPLRGRTLGLLESMIENMGRIKLRNETGEEIEIREDLWPLALANAEKSGWRSGWKPNGDLRSYLEHGRMIPKEESLQIAVALNGKESNRVIEFFKKGPVRIEVKNISEGTLSPEQGKKERGQ